jgi:CheY-like chemotaxis protein
MQLKIMVADDEPESLKLMRSLTNAFGYFVQTFDNLEEAGQCAQKQRFDVAFVGMRVPELEGIELAQRIRRATLNGETTIVMLSATEDIDSLRKAFGKGANFVLTKPVTAARLRPMLAAMDSPGWKSRQGAARLPIFTDVICKWDDRQFPLRSMNISETGMLLQPSVDIEVGKEVELEFKIREVHASLQVRARIVRKDGDERVGIEFIGLAPEEQNAVQLYVLGGLKDLTPRRNLTDVRPDRGLFRP